MIHLEFTEEEKQSLYYERFHHPHPRVQLKAEVIWLKSQNLPHQQICQLAGISPNTWRTYCQDYQEGGIEKLKEINFYHAKYYEDFFQFSSAISGCLNEAHLKHKKELDSLLTLRFQRFNKAQIMTV